jgi:hypothetical protein
MSATRRGISNHELVETYERDAMTLRDAGISDDLAERFAAVLRWDAMGLTASEKRADYRRYFPEARQHEPR